MEELLPAGDKKLEDILKKTCSTMEQSKGEIFEIYENTKREVEAMRQEYEEVKKSTRELQNKVDKLAEVEKREKQMLVRVSSNFGKMSEDKIKATYEAVKNAQVELGVFKEKEYQERKKRDSLELQLRNMENTLKAAEHLATKLGSVMTYMTSHLSDMVSTMEIASKNKFLGVQVLKAQEEERLRVSREIHDGPAKDLANVLYQATISERLIDLRPEEAKAELQKIRRKIRENLTDLNQIAFDLRPVSLDELGLVAALEKLATKLQDRNALTVKFEVDGKAYPLEKHVEVSLYRIIQEAISNVVKHADADVALVKMLFGQKELSIVIADTGLGFDLEKAEAGDKFGLLGMKERAGIIGATLNIVTAEGQGTKVYVKYPYKQE